MKLVVGIVLFLTGVSWGVWQVRRYLHRPTEAFAEDALDVILGFAPNAVAVLFLTVSGSVLVYLHFTEV